MNIASDIGVLFVLFFLLWRLRHRDTSFFLRPSIVFIVLGLLLYLIPITLFRDKIRVISPYIDEVGLLLSLVFSIAIVLIYLGQKFLVRFEIRKDASEPGDAGKFLAFAIAILIGITFIYFQFRDFKQTGLYALLCSPENYTLWREQSMKLLKQKWLSYLYLIGFSFLCPLICAFLVDKIVSTPTKQRIIFASLGFPIVAIVVFYLMITGARVGILNCVFAVTGVLFLRLSFYRFLIAFSGCVAGGIAIAVLISILSVGGGAAQNVGFCTDSRQEPVVSLSEEIFPGDYLDGVIHRMMIMPGVIAGFFVEEAYGNFRPLEAFAIRDRNIANLIATKYGQRLFGREPVETALAPTTFIFMNFLYFGYFSVIVSIIGIVLLDAPLFFLNRLPWALSVPLVSVGLFYSAVFLQTGFFTVFFSHGYAFYCGLIGVTFLWHLRAGRGKDNLGIPS
ncbi:hypothetical protein D3C87_410550 [compost metagenome]